ncbi:MAG: acyl carrier protein [Blastocatellia bacterium]|nr:acyl carrier protein [Blastocatellia bacterium]
MLSPSITNYLQQAAREARTEMPERTTSLFDAGLLDSFSLVEFVSLLEEEYGVRVSDAELKPSNFDTIAKIEAFVSQTKVADL